MTDLAKLSAQMDDASLSPRHRQSAARYAAGVALDLYRTGQLVERDGVAGVLTDKQLSEIGQQIAGKSPWGKRTANYCRIYQAAVLGAIAALTAIKGGEDAREWTETPGGHHAD